MTVGESLRRSIASSPDDDLPRLIYADWLEENGQGLRAEFIRVQCELARPPPRGETLETLQRRERELWSGGEDLFDWKTLCKLGARHFTVERGMVSGVSIPCMRLLANADRLLETAPGLTALSLTETTPREASDLARSPLLRRIKKLEFNGDNRIGAAGAEALAGSPHIAGLRQLRLGHCALGHEGMEAIASATCLGALEVLGLSGNNLRTSEIESLAWSDHLLLRELDLHANYLGPDGAALLSDSPLLGQLVRLDLGVNDIGRAGAAALAGSPKADGLRQLDLLRNGIDAEGVRTLANSSGLFSLQSLNLSHNPIGDTGARALAGGRLETLIELDVQSADLGAEGAWAMARSPNLGRLRRLGLCNNRVGPRVEAAIASMVSARTVEAAAQR